MPSENRSEWLGGGAKPLWAAFALLAVCCVLFLTLNVRGDWQFVLTLRLTKLAALLLAAYAVSVSTVLFQTLTNNPILTPSILGFDSLYIFLQTLMVFALGGIGYTALPPLGKFGFEVLMMLGGSLLLFYTLMKQGGRDLTRMILIGVVFGIFFRSISALLQRMIDPEEFIAAQANMFASFNTLNTDLVGIGLAVAALSAVALARERHRLDVLLLGRSQAVNLGIAYPRLSLRLLLWVAVLVAVSTAVVGPVSFFGLLTAALANYFSPTVRHAVRLPTAFCIGGILLIGGQTLFEHLLGMQGVLSAVVEFAGGFVFLYLIFRKKR
ncbi:iron chelate uptake ABC transporter family permease subunit [Neisseria lisongii]|uniref:Iron chelate uptake ABC transporter family permease subunit n=1 Tax=Neisseria lisongii TaxID=2912188 RepID=A0AAW5AQ06_9NEIS|nr:iron chelate uptake ABC transporter family permease subunit [Neisseria lisongii]MCF7529105.1 iron chelate uptake ABC transporter family permease subunit [Neisseria lisongii]